MRTYLFSHPGSYDGGMFLVLAAGLFLIVSDFATPGQIYLLTRSIMACSDRGGVENEMTDNLKVKASKAADDTNVAAHAAYDDATVVVHNALKGAGVDAQNVSDDAKMGVHKAVSDAKIAVHKAGSDLKKK